MKGIKYLIGLALFLPACETPATRMLDFPRGPTTRPTELERVYFAEGLERTAGEKTYRNSMEDLN